MKKFFAGIVAAFLATTAYAQNQGTVTNHAYAIGKGPGVTGYTSLLCASGQLAVGQAADPICRTVSGDWTLNAAGVATLATVNANVGTFGSATQSSQVALDAKGRVTSATSLTVTPAVGSVTGLGTGVATALGINIGSAGAPVTFNGAGGTPSSLTLTNATGLPISTGVSGLGAGCATFLGTPSSANLRGCLTDEVGTGAAYFVNGALGTPASGTGTNLTGIPNAGLVNSTITIAGSSTALGGSYAPFRGESKPANPTGTTSGAQVMAGLAGSFTPATSGKMQLMAQSTIANSTINDGCIVQMRFGTGAAPTNGAAATGTTVGNQQTAVSFAANAQNASTLIGYVTGLTPATVYWFDLGMAAVTGGTCSPTAIVMDAFEQ